jgi:hypothetical protein
LSTLIAHDFAAIHARQRAIGTAEHPMAATPGLPADGFPTQEPATSVSDRDFYAWLMNGGLWACGAPSGG